VRLFVAVWPPEDVMDVIASMPRPEVPGLRWTTRSQWHVTLRFLGDVEERVVPQLTESFLLLLGTPRASAVLGPETAWFPGRRVLQLPVAGLEDLRTKVNDLIAQSGVSKGEIKEPEENFTGHLTLARVRGSWQGGTGRGGRSERIERTVGDSLAGQIMRAEWPVNSVSLVASSLRSDGAQYTDIAQVVVG